jgi:monoamine oxidase
MSLLKPYRFRHEISFPIPMEKQSLIIIGAGAAGLMAGYKLADKMDIIILEAQDRIGGRMETIKRKNRNIEAGAEFVHGNLPVTLGLLKDAGISFEEAEGKIYRHRNSELKEQDEMIEGWDALLDQMKELDHDMTVINFLDKYYPAPSEIRNEMIAYAEGFDLADAAKASTKKLYEEWSREDEANYRIPSGYTALAEYLASELIKKGGTIHTGLKVQEIRQTKTGISVLNSTGQEFSADRVLISIPVNALAGSNENAAITFDPPLPDYQQAAANIGFGKVVKIVMEFRNSFWNTDGGFFISNQPFRTWWTQLPNRTAVLTGWAGSNAAAALQNLSDDEILEKAVNSLSVIFNFPANKVKEELVDFHIFNLQKEPFICGGYSYSKPASDQARKLLNEPVNNKIFFAGEALYAGEHPGTVEAALVSGSDAAEKILKAIE